MANSYNSYTASGTNSTFAITINYLLGEHIHVFVDDVEFFSPATWSKTGEDIIFVVDPVASANVKLVRQTPRTLATRLVDFSDASIITEADLDTSAIQLLYIVQEAFETNITGTLDTDFIAWSNSLAAYDAEEKRIARVLDPTLDQDAATKKYVDDTALQLSGGEYDAGSLPINNVEDPTDLQDAATKNYVDQVAIWGHTGTPQTTLLTSSSAANSYTLTGVAGASTEMVIVTLGGVVQVPGSGNDYTITAGDPNSTLVLTAFPPDGLELFIYAIGRELLIPTVNIGAGEITTAMLADGSVTAVKLATDSVSTIKILDDAVTNDKIATDAVNADSIAAGSVDTSELASDSVTEAKIADLAVDYANLKVTSFATAPATSTDQFIAIDKTTGNQSKKQLTTVDLTDFNSALAATPVSTLAAATASVNMGSNKIISVADPTLAQDAATKAYVDTEVAGLSASGARGPYLLIDQTLGTPATSFEVAGFLASQYVRYEVVISNLKIASSLSWVELRYRNSSSGLYMSTSAEYDGAIHSNTLGGTATQKMNTNEAIIGETTNANIFNGRFDLYNNLTTVPALVSTVGTSVNSATHYNFGFTTSTVVNVDGIRISANGLTINTGNIKVYGYTAL